MGLFDFLKSKPNTKKNDLPDITAPDIEKEPAAKPQPQGTAIKVGIPPRQSRAKQETQDWYERKLSPFQSDIVKLAGYSSDDVQYAIGYMKRNDPVYIKKTSGRNGDPFQVFNEYGEKVGKIPARFEGRCREDKIIFAMFEDPVFGKTNCQPAIRIFWDSPACESSPVFRMDAINTNTLSSYKKLDSYVALDLETTGFDGFRDEIIEIGLAKIKNGEIVSEYSTLVNPGIPIPRGASAVNGIYDKDVVRAPKIHDVIHAVDAFLGDEIIVGHNVTFDLRFLKTAMLGCGISKKVRYVDTLSVSRRVLPNLKNHKLQTLMETAGINEGQSHRALDDAIHTHQVLQYCIQEKIRQNEASQKERKARKQAEDAERAQKYSHSPLYDKLFVFTGDFHIARSDMEKMLLDVGAVPRANIIKKTHYLVTGDVSDLPDWALDRKLHKAEDMIKNGSNIKIINETEFLELVKNAQEVLAE